MTTNRRQIKPQTIAQAVKAETARVGMTKGEAILDRRITDTARTLDADIDRIAKRIDEAICRLSVRVSVLEVKRKPWWRRWLG